uniref:Uncharacterized protein n=1 Tax=Coccolithus braarudii TaxID=221442 RepID=A0A7S0LQI0_9EUKA
MSTVKQAFRPVAAFAPDAIHSTPAKRHVLTPAGAAPLGTWVNNVRNESHQAAVPTPRYAAARHAIGEGAAQVASATTCVSASHLLRIRLPSYMYEEVPLRVGRCPHPKAATPRQTRARDTPKYMYGFRHIEISNTASLGASRCRSTIVHSAAPVNVHADDGFTGISNAGTE